MCFKQAIWKPLVNAFATMCGLVVPIALAHAGCIIFSPCTTVGLLRLARCESGCQKASVGAPRWFVSKPEVACASGARPSAKEDVDATIARCNRLADDINPIKKFLGFTYIGDATGSLNHYHGQWCGRSWATSMWTALRPST